ncbi:hypothetical protein E1B28_011932 [Marasmius oreades]|uniref:Superoxide dismutase n=1 Tax=Marasmius oreades TaxID=181124 RepID=A0A9P7RQL4_9AGAR|nr:uncharacterized protein E1B28_011932 [Marasmius oreades]KAG7087885.1 hypothetical protein E1B28_011932 [Marasmius oreades]
MPVTLPDLDYPHDGLEPYISKEIMCLHHLKHHQAYVTAYNAAEEALKKACTPKEQIRLQAAINFNGGGHINHSLFWKNLAPKASGKCEPCGGLKKAIVDGFGSVENFKKEFNDTTIAIQGSGWGWLVYNNKTKQIEITTTSNQDILIAKYCPIIGVDIWEHAFYLQYKNVKKDYLDAIWNVINFEEAERRYQCAASGKPECGSL